MLGRLIIIDTGWQTVAVVQDLLEVLFASTQAGYVIGWKVSQSSEEGTADIPKYQVTLKRASGSYTSGSGGAAATVVKGQTGDPAAGFTGSERNNTTQAVAGTGTLEELDGDVLNESEGNVSIDYIPEEWFPIGPSEAAIVSIEEAPSSQTIRAILKILVTHG